MLAKAIPPVGRAARAAATLSIAGLALAAAGALTSGGMFYVANVVPLSGKPGIAVVMFILFYAIVFVAAAIMGIAGAILGVFGLVRERRPALGIPAVVLGALSGLLPLIGLIVVRIARQLAGA
jgi:hypothetical protein